MRSRKVRTPGRVIPFDAVIVAVGMTVAFYGCEEGPTAVQAEPSLAPLPTFGAATEHRAALFMDQAGNCAMFDGDGNLVLGLSAKVNVLTQSPYGNALHNCFTKVPNPARRAIRFTADDNPFGVLIPCTIFDGEGNGRQTFDWREQISASGRAHLICVLHP